MPALSLAPAGGPLALVVVATPRGSIAMPIAASSIPQGTFLLAPSVQARKEASRAFAVSPIGIAERFDEHGFFLRGALHHRHGDCAMPVATINQFAATNPRPASIGIPKLYTGCRTQAYGPCTT